jgi:predicted house-cleaning NTP pyrophosphatase (Maf/HAM1 superfamily)
VNSFIYLASQSPRRRQLLEQLGVAYQLLLPDADEDAEALEQAQALVPSTPRRPRRSATPDTPVQSPNRSNDVARA